MTKKAEPELVVDLVSAESAPPHGGDERFRALFEHAPVGVALCDPGGRFVDVNPSFRDLLVGTGIDPDDGSLEDLVRYAAAGSDEATGWLDDLGRVRAGTRDVARAEVSVAPPDAAPRWLEATAVRVVLGEQPYLLAHIDDTTRRRLEEQRLVRLALHDGLTGLANRTLLAERLEDALARGARSGLPVGVIYLDLDGFKGVNDRYGHAAGDELLVAVAERLTRVLRAGDTAGRLGGDEFLVVAGDVVNAAALAEIMRRVEAALRVPIPVDGAEVVVVASCGAVLSRPGETADTVVRRADAAMYAAKRARRRRTTRRPPAQTDPVQLALLHEQAAVARPPDVVQPIAPRPALIQVPGQAGPSPAS
jgi:diguanylate cyclase (GGDEF)-like protein